MFCVYVTYHPTGKFYVGKGKTVDVNSGKYQGSGRILKNAWQKYPRPEWFTQILSEHKTEAEAYEREALLVDEKLLKHPRNLNIQLGGNPTMWAKTWRNPNFQSAMSKRAWSKPSVQKFQREKTAERWKTGPLRAQQQAGIKALWDDEVYRARMSEQRSERIKGIRWVSKAGVKRQVPIAEVDAFIADGWNRGMKC